MGVIGGIAALVAVSVVLAATLAVYPSLWRAYRDSWQRIPAGRRSRAWFAIGLFVLACVVVVTLLTAEPWGRHTIVWVFLVGGSGVMVLALAGATAQGIIDVRRARRRRAEND